MKCKKSEEFDEMFLFLADSAIKAAYWTDLVKLLCESRAP